MVPADEWADIGESGGERLKAEVAGREIEFLIVQRVVGNMHLAIPAGEFAIGVEDNRGIVVNARCAPLEYRADDNDAQSLG